MMSRRFILIFLLVIATFVRSQCPAKCSCRRDSKELDCSGQDLVKLPNPPYSKLIKTLDLSRNHIPILKDHMFQNSQILTLTSLVIADNQELSEIQQNAFIGLSTLKHLDLSGNDIAALDSGVFETLFNLETLILNRNPLILPDNGFSLDSLPSISMIGCGLSKIPSNFFQNMLKLKHLNLTSNELVSFDSKIVSSLVDLESLDISRNKLTNPREIIYDLPLSVKDLETVKNEWVCDCDLKNIDASYAKRFNEQEFMCSSPPEFRNNVITDDVISRILCVPTTEEIVRTTTAHVDVDDDVVQADGIEDILQDKVDLVDVVNDVVDEEKSERIQMPPVRENILVIPDENRDDAVMGAGVGGVAMSEDESNWASSNQWWLVGGAAFAVMIGIIVILMIQVRRFGKRHEQGSFSETEYL